MARELEGKVAVVTGAASGIGLASSEAMLAAGARVVMVDRDQGALQALGKKYGGAVIPLLIDLLDPKDCATLLPRVMEAAGGLDILHANAGSYVGGELVDNDTDSIDRMLNLNVNVVMKNVRDVLPHMIARRTGDIIVTSSLAAHFPTPWEPVYASSKWAINCFVQTVRRQVFKHGIRVGSISPGPVISALLADWPAEKLKQARESGSLLEADEVAQVLIFMLTRPRGMTIRDVVMLPTNFDL
ncbi:MAG: SDR family oxidoreductase [Rhodocyclaceae bacterium]|nr:SDR family oxidoreductase [Rhodocyclaceae bacterium]MCP5231239.1 SDR family oxidoreductase [Zoogloeaceae bacterium]MCP5241435.1 SDR family oxidoreductase [Zoogloeaceae bacterium]MCP5252984.1 SDR family oxidoreductase [Zoogloeaceae bacterium]MCP5293250.1 SDR family oxidoreductase [Zoogloeaceae bacterium]